MDRAKQMEKDLQHRQKHYEADVKFRILHLLEHGNTSPEEIAKSFGISAKTLYNWRDAYDALGMSGLEDAPKSGRPRLVSLDKVKDVVETVRDQGMITVKRVKDQISKICNVGYSNGHVWSVLTEMGMTYKKADPIHRRAATNAEIEQWADENMPVIKKYMSKGYPLLSVDEIHPGIDDTSNYGYAESSQRVYATHHGTKKRLNIVGAIASSGRSIFRTQKRSNSDTFIKFLKDLHAKFPRAILLLDQAKYHTSKRVKKWLREHRGIIVIYLPVASPHMNSIENLWNMMYLYLRRVGYNSFEEFKYHIFYFLRRRAFNLDVIGKLDSRLDPAAEEQIIRVRQS